MNIESGANTEVGLERRGRCAILTLRRPAVLNALSHAMIRAIYGALQEWEADPQIEAVIVRGEGRAFSAGGDVARVCSDVREGNSPLGFFADEYRLNARIKVFSKPYIALADGVVMGGGAGISVHGSHCLFTEKVKFAMPEVAIGFIPDVGGSYFLPRLPGRFGYWLGLTGSRLGWGDCLKSGIATAAIPSESQEALVEELSAGGDIDGIIARHGVQPQPELTEGDLAAINEVFAGESIEAILDRLEGREEPWAQQSLRSMQRGSPTALRVTLRLLSEGATLSLQDCLKLEYRIVSRMLAGHDFPEGVRAALVDKDGKPAWRPSSLAGVGQADVDAYFAPLPDGELEFD